MSSRAGPPTLSILLCLVLSTTQVYAQPAALLPGDKYHLVFVTSQNLSITTDRTVPPASSTSFGGIPAANWVTTSLAASAGANSPFGLSALHYTTGNPNGPAWDSSTPGPWQAILSDSIDGNAIDRILITAPVYNTKGDLVATDRDDLWDGILAAPISYDEKGILRSGNVWSGTNSAGFWSGASCNDWDDPSAVNSGDQGIMGRITASWIRAGTAGCNLSARLYAISPELTVLQPGDVDQDLDVDALDFLLWQRGRGTGPTDARLIDGDLDGDGDSDGADLVVWEANYGLPLSSNATTVPEPGTFSLAIAGLCLAKRRR